MATQETVGVAGTMTPEQHLVEWVVWDFVRGLGGSLDDPRYRRAQLRYALEVD